MTAESMKGHALRAANRTARESRNGHAPADPGPPQPPPVEASDFFGRDGLLVVDLAQAVLRSVTCGFNELTQQFYVYEGGVWRQGNAPIEAEIVRLLGNRYRDSHCRNVFAVIRHQSKWRITCDPVPKYINARNGMVDWATQRVRPHRPGDLSTVQISVDYDAHAQCPRFDAFLAQVRPPDCIEFFWEVIGYVLYNGNPLHTAILLLGKGRNGKGTLIRVLKRIVGAHNCSAVGLHELAENRFRTATLYGKLANLAGDLDSRWLSNTATFKAITGGDLIQGENKYGAAFDFSPWALPVYSANRPFGSSDSSEGWVSRWTVVPFPNTFSGNEDRELDARLQTEDELRGIVAKGIAALPNLIKRGRFDTPRTAEEC